MSRYQGDGLANHAKRPVENLDKKRGLTNPETGGSATKNAGASPNATGAHIEEKAANFRSQSTPKRRFNAMSKYAKPSHRAAARMVGYALTLGGADAWLGASAVFAARLTVAERVSLAYATLHTLDDDDAYLTASTALFGGAIS